MDKFMKNTSEFALSSHHLLANPHALPSCHLQLPRVRTDTLQLLLQTVKQDFLSILHSLLLSIEEPFLNIEILNEIEAFDFFIEFLFAEELDVGGVLQADALEVGFAPVDAGFGELSDGF